MKKYILLAAFVAAGVISVSQTQDVMTVKMKDGTSHEFKVEDVSEVTFGSSEINPHYPVAEAIDLGLPSGTLWASWNIGASSPEDYGGYYAWGETEIKDVYSTGTYKYYDNAFIHIGDNIASTQYDVAHIKWGGRWHMPTNEQIKELIENCSKTWITQNGVRGQLVTGPNGSSIFLPAAGRKTSSLIHDGLYGNYWSSSLDINDEGQASFLIFTSSEWARDEYTRVWGYPVRAVITPEEKPQDCPVAEAIDLGLPSGTKWASWNVGASKPEDYGGYYGWGETETKDVYNQVTYEYCSGIDNDGDGFYEGNTGYQHIGDDIASTEFDVAHVKWGGSWRMPSYDQIKELRKYCTRTFTQQNGVDGTLVTGPNGNTIFLPASGYKLNDAIKDEGKCSIHWTSTLAIKYYEAAAYYLFSGMYDWNWGDNHFRHFGYSVRPVCK